MEIEFYPGYHVFSKGSNPLFVCPHSGPSVEVPTARDDNSDTVGSLAWMNSNGKLILSTISRKVIFGIDFNRDHPKKEDAIDIWGDFLVDEDSDKLMEYREKYAFVAKDKKDFEQRSKIYKSFWKEVEKSTNIIFIHRKFTRLKNYPSIMDFISFQGKGVDQEKLKDIINFINGKYQNTFKKMESHYKSAILLEAKRVLDRVDKLYGLDWPKIKVEYKKHLVKDKEFIDCYASNDSVSKLNKNFTKENFILAAEDALSNAGPPEVTLERIFKGQKASASKDPLFEGRNILEVESNAFLNYWYPKTASKIILEVMKELDMIK